MRRRGKRRSAVITGRELLGCRLAGRKSARRTAEQLGNVITLVEEGEGWENLGLEIN